MARSFFRTTKWILILLILIGGAWLLKQWVAEEEIIRIDGKVATVIDGDSFKLGDDEFRIYGIDAPEYRQKCRTASGTEWDCGKISRMGLDRQLRGTQYSCAVSARDQFGRAIVQCADGKATDLGSTLVRQGMAVSGQHFDEIYYGADEQAAEKAKLGIWQGEFVRPEVWRQQNPRK